jgi:NAD(P)-dependent dehydrogenase (short-subunit alcohol dehydrogenase family)
MWAALDLGSPPLLTDQLRAHPLVRLAAEAAAVAVVTRQDAVALLAAQRLLGALRASGAGEVRVWVAAYDTSDPVTLAEMRALFGCEVEEAPAPPERLPGGRDPLTGISGQMCGRIRLKARYAA